MNIKEDYIKALISSGAVMIRSINEEPFTLRSGRKSYVFVNHSRMANSSKSYITFIDGVRELLLEEYKNNEFLLCNVDSKISGQMAGTLAYILKKPQIVFKSAQLTAIEKGPGEQFTGDNNCNLPVAIVDDVATGGDGTAKRVADGVKDAFFGVEDIQLFVGLVRNVKLLSKTFTYETYRAHYVASYDEVLDSVWKELSDGQKKAIEKERKELL